MVYSADRMTRFSLIWEHQSFSPFVADPVDHSTLCLSGTQCVRHAANTYSLVYNINVFAGVYVGLGVSYIDHPSTSWSPNALPYGSAAAPNQSGAQRQSRREYAGFLVRQFMSRDAIDPCNLRRRFFRLFFLFHRSEQARRGSAPAGLQSHRPYCGRRDACH